MRIILFPEYEMTQPEEERERERERDRKKKGREREREPGCKTHSYMRREAHYKLFCKEV